MDAPVPPSPVREQFLVDHRRLEDLASRFLAAVEAGDHAALIERWDELDAGVSAHLEVEDTVLVPILLRVSERDARAIVQEHRHLRTRLIELRKAVDQHAIRSDVARAFGDELRAHCGHEDNVLYRFADNHVTADDQELLDRLLAEVTEKRRADRARQRRTPPVS